MMVKLSLDETCDRVSVDLVPWLPKATFRSAFAWHNNLLTEV